MGPTAAPNVAAATVPNASDTMEPRTQQRREPTAIHDASPAFSRDDTARGFEEIGVVGWYLS